MRFDFRNPGALFKRLLAGALFAATASWLAAPALAQTIRFVPVQPAFTPGVGTTVSIFVDNVPAAGLLGFSIRFTYDDSLIDLLSATVDPNLLVFWGGVPFLDKNIPPTSGSGTAVWEVRSDGNHGHPAGTVRLGGITFRGGFNANGNGSFAWVDPNTTIATSSQNSDVVVPIQLDASFTVGTPESDVKLSCTQTSPADPNHFVDGDTITFDCTVCNLGPKSTRRATSALAVISFDGIVDSTDSFIGDATVNLLGDPNGAGDPNNPCDPNIPGDPNKAAPFQKVTLSGAPVFTIPGQRKICVKADVNLQDRDQQNGTLLEPDESNNLICSDVTIDFPRRDLTVPNVPDPNDPNTLIPAVSISGPTDPNVHAGSGALVQFTVKNIGPAIARDHTNGVFLSTDSVIDPLTDQRLCELPEVFLAGSIPQGLLGGQSETRAFGLDPNKPTEQQCAIKFGQSPGSYFIGVVADIFNQVLEEDPNGNSLEGNNTNLVPVEILPPLPPTITAANPKFLNDRRQELDAPGKATAFFSAFSILDLASYTFTLAWDPNLIAIGDPNILAGDPNDAAAESAFLAANGRVASCQPLAINNALGTVTVSCDSSGTQAGATVQLGQALLTVQFTTVAPGTGMFTFPSVSGKDSMGNTVNFTISDGTFVVSGPPDDQFSNLVAPSEIFPGTAFQTSFDICNQGFSASNAGITTTVQVSADPNVTRSDPTVCAVIESSPLAARDCISHTLPACSLAGDLRPGNYTLGVTLDPNTQMPQATQALPFPPRIFALRAKGGGKAIESTRAPDPNGSVGSLLAFDKRFKPRSIGALRTTVRNFNLVAGYIKLSRGQKVALYRTPKFPDIDLDKQSTSILRLPNGTVAVMGGADVNGDGEDELILLKRSRNGEFLDFRLVNYARRRPEVGISIAVTAPSPDKIVGAAGIQIDGDVEDEVAIVTDDGTAQALTINDLTIVDPNDAPSGLVPLASDPSFGGGAADKVLDICVIDFDLDGTPLAPDEQIVALTENASRVQSLKVFDPPAGLPNQAVLVVEDTAFGGTTGRARALSIACTR